MILSEVREQNNDTVISIVIIIVTINIKSHLFHISNDLKTKEGVEIIRRQSFYITVAQEWSIYILLTLVVPPRHIVVK